MYMSKGLKSLFFFKVTLGRDVILEPLTTSLSNCQPPIVSPCFGQASAIGSSHCSKVRPGIGHLRPSLSGSRRGCHELRRLLLTRPSRPSSSWSSFSLSPTSHNSVSNKLGSCTLEWSEILRLMIGLSLGFLVMLELIFGFWTSIHIMFKLVTMKLTLFCHWNSFILNLNTLSIHFV